MADQPPQTAVILKGWGHLSTCLSQTLPTQLYKAHAARRAAMNLLRKGKV